MTAKASKAKGKTGGFTDTMTFKTPKTLAAKLRRIAKAKNQPVSNIIRSAVTDYLESEAAK